MMPLLSAVACLALGAPSSNPAAAELDTRTAAMTRELMPVYTWLHAHPELSRQERETSKLMAQRWRAVGAEVHENLGGFGVVAILRNRRQPRGPWVIARTDMDGLPVQEATGVPYASVNKEVMHACGHDIHMTAALGVAQLLRNDEKSWHGTVVFVGQPAEEVVTGARAMLQDPRFITLLQPLGAPKAVLSVHDDAELAAGTVGMRAGAVNANVDSLDITVHGVGGHGAKPAGTVDATVMAAEMVLSLQTVVSRRLPPGTPAVLTVGQLESGHKRNIISSRATLKLTLRSYSTATRQTLLTEIKRVVDGIAQAYGAPAMPDIAQTDEHVSAVVNDPALTAAVSRALTQLWGKERVLEIQPSMGGEDFAEFAVHYGVPALLINIGGVRTADFARRDTVPLPTLHSEKWAPDPVPTLQTAMAAMLTAVRAVLEQS